MMSFERIMEMRNRRATLVAEGRAVIDKAAEEKRELTAEDTQKYDKILEDVRQLKENIEREERQVALESEMRDFAGKPAAQNPQAETVDKRTAAFRNYLQTGVGLAEARALANDVNTEGGYLSATEQFIAELIKGIDNQVFVKQYARVIPVTTSDSLGIPTLASDVSDPDWTTEIGQIQVDTSLAFGKRELKPTQLTKLVKTSMKLLRTSAIPVEALIQERLSFKFAVALENAFLNGNGTNSALGVFTASANGIPTSRDISKGNTTAAITADGLVATKYALKQQYRVRNSVRWLFHRDTIADIAMLKDANGQYIWRPGLESGQPDKLLNIPIDESEYAPSAFVSGAYVGILADWSYYWIAELHGLEMQRLNELYAETSQIGFIGRGYWDGMPVLADAFARVTLA